LARASTHPATSARRATASARHRALQTAIDTCTRDGGGTVLVPAGTFHIEPWSSRATSHCTSPPRDRCSAARTDGSTRRRRVPLTGDSTLSDGNWALIFAVAATQRLDRGSGLIDGQASVSRPDARATPRAASAAAAGPITSVPPLRTSSRARIRLWQSAYHSVRVIQSKHVQMDGLHIFNRVNATTTDFISSAASTSR